MVGEHLVPYVPAAAESLLKQLLLRRRGVEGDLDGVVLDGGLGLTSLCFPLDHHCQLPRLVPKGEPFGTSNRKQNIFRGGLNFPPKRPIKLLKVLGSSADLPVPKGSLFGSADKI